MKSLAIILKRVVFGGCAEGAGGSERDEASERWGHGGDEIEAEQLAAPAVRAS